MALVRGAMVAAVLASPAGAQAVVNGRTVYEAAFFAPFAPSNALQIVQRVPGFQFDRGDTEIRGFAAAAGNVVINGQRPSSKSDTLESVLARLPASQVLRVEVGAGDLFGSEYSGRAQVANLVLASAAAVAGTLEATVRRQFTAELTPEGTASALVKRGASTFNASVGVDNDQTTEEGIDRLVALPGGREVEFRRKVNDVDGPDGFVSAGWAHEAGPRESARLNGRFAVQRFALTQNNDVYPASGPVRDDLLTQRYRRRAFELGGDLTRPFAGGGLKLIGLATRRYRVNRDLSLNRVRGVAVGGFAQTLDDASEETLLRLVWDRAGVAGWNLEAGGEGVLNRLDSRVDLESIAADGTRRRIDLPVDDAVVKEWRGEAFVNAGRSLSPRLRVDLGLTFEASRLTVTGDAEAERTLKFLKPKASFDWRGAGGWRAQVSVARTVAQLQFEDFISAAELTNERVNGGNAELVPQRAWEFRATVERPILGDGAFKLELGHERISLVQDRVPTPEGFDAPGNLGSGTLTLARGTLEVPLARFGVKGGRLRTYVSWVRTSVRDPYSGRARPFSGYDPIVVETSFRQDLGSFAWGVEASVSGRSTTYRRDELDSFLNAGPYLTAFAEYRPSRRTSMTLGLDNALDTKALRERRFFTPNRTSPDPVLFERRERNRHIVPYLTVKHSFG